MDDLRVNLREAIEGWLEAGAPESTDNAESEILEVPL
jgi:hypothetical protein